MVSREHVSTCRFNPYQRTVNPDRFRTAVVSPEVRSFLFYIGTRYVTPSTSRTSIQLAQGYTGSPVRGIVARVHAKDGPHRGSGAAGGRLLPRHGPEGRAQGIFQ